MYRVVSRGVAYGLILGALFGIVDVLVSRALHGRYDWSLLWKFGIATFAVAFGGVIGAERRRAGGSGVHGKSDLE
jgi:hypothetical protein